MRTVKGLWNYAKERRYKMEIIKPGYVIETPLNEEEILSHIERCGRVAYKSEDKITKGSAEKFIRSILKRGHESVIEHFSFSVRFICDRGVTHELVRHRLAAYTQESTRYCNYAKKGVQFIKPFFWLGKENAAGETVCVDAKYLIWLKAMKTAEECYNELIAMGASPQEARSVLPNSLKTEIVATANVREWRHILRLRTSKAAHPQIREVMVPLLAELKRRLPVLFEDIEVDIWK